jgi:hypothetical protein
MTVHPTAALSSSVHLTNLPFSRVLPASEVITVASHLTFSVIGILGVSWGVGVGAAEVVKVVAGAVTGVEIQAVKTAVIISKETRIIHILPAVSKLLLINPL